MHADVDDLLYALPPSLSPRPKFYCITPTLLPHALFISPQKVAHRLRFSSGDNSAAPINIMHIHMFVCMCMFISNCWKALQASSAAASFVAFVARRDCCCHCCYCCACCCYQLTSSVMSMFVYIILLVMLLVLFRTIISITLLLVLIL